MALLRRQLGPADDVKFPRSLLKGLKWTCTGKKARLTPLPCYKGERMTFNDELKRYDNEAGTKLSELYHSLAAVPFKQLAVLMGGACSGL